MNKTEERRTDKRRRNKMTVRAFCTCTHPYECSRFCGIDEAQLYVTLENYVNEAVGNYGTP